MRIGIVGNAQDKFTKETERKARDVIREILLSADKPVTLVSGHCHQGGVDIYSEEIADELGIPGDIKTPKVLCWDDGRGGYGFKARNIDIARCSDEVHVIVVKEYPPGYTDRKFASCYHCERMPGNDPRGHVKSGSCWTALQAKRMGKRAIWHIID